jgi:Fe-S-cluster containining protein
VFADDIVLITEDEQHLKDAIDELHKIKIKVKGFELNLEKCVIVTDHKDYKERGSIAGIIVKRKSKYLGFPLSCDRKEIKNNTLKKLNKFKHSVVDKPKCEFLSKKTSRLI